MSANTVAADMVVSMNYVLTDTDGKVLDESKGEPLQYLQGHSNIIPGLEKELVGLAPGDKKKVVVQPNEGYGELNPELRFALPRDQFGGQDVEAGMMVTLQSPEGMLNARVMEVGEAEIGMDANHPLAGQVLTFEVEITDIRPASDEEKQHGHPHGPGGHHH